MQVQIILNGETRSTQTVTDGIEPLDAKRLALAAAIKAADITIAEALLVEFHIIAESVPKAG